MLMLLTIQRKDVIYKKYKWRCRYRLHIFISIQ